MLPNRLTYTGENWSPTGGEYKKHREHYTILYNILDYFIQ